MARLQISSFITLFFILFFLYSCSPGDKNISTYTVSYTNYENSLIVDGYTEPVRSTTAICPYPPYVEGTVSYLVEDGTYVEEGEVIAIIEAMELQTQYDQLLISLENAEAGLTKTQADLKMQYALLEAQVKTNEADTEIARLDSLQLKYSTPNQARIKELNLEKVAIEKARYEKKKETLAIIQQSEIKKLELELQRLTTRVQEAERQLEALEVKAPKGGLAIRAIYPMTGAKLQVGDAVWSRMNLVNIPDFSEMKIKMNVSETDYKQINVNDSVIYTFDAMPENIAWGKITMKSPVGQAMNQGSKVKFFEIEASVDSVLYMPEPGFTANCQIILQQEKNSITIPQIAIFEQDSIKVVYVKKKNNFERRQILTGISSPKEAVIVAGLNSGEEVALSKPQDSWIKNTVLLTDSLANKTVQNVNVLEMKINHFQHSILAPPISQFNY